MNLTILDLEMNKPSGNIIQIGAVVGNLESGEILDYVSIYVKLPDGEQLSEFIKTLTGITQEQVDTGVSLLEAYSQLRVMHEKHKCFLNPVTWGGGDSQYLYKQLQDMHPESSTPWCFGQRWIDAKTLYVCQRMAKGDNPRSGLSKSMARLGLQFRGSKHNGCDDAFNTFRMFRKLVLDKDAGSFEHLHLGSKN